MLNLTVIRYNFGTHSDSEIILLLPCTTLLQETVNDWIHGNN